MLRQRLFGIALGYFDCNDYARGLASQPTLSRFENTVGLCDLLRMARTLAASVLQRQQERHQTALVITIDLAPTHGDQQLSLFNHFYDSGRFLLLPRQDSVGTGRRDRSQRGSRPSEREAAGPFVG